MITTLDKLKKGEKGIIVSVSGDNPLRHRLLDMGLIPKTEVIMIKTAPMGDPVELSLRGYELTLRKADAAGIRIETIGKERGSDKK